MPIIYHITTLESWAKQHHQDFYEAESLYSEGFIHCSTKEQVAGVLQRYYKGAGELFLLYIDPEKLIATLEYEISTGNELFPHVYGKINREAIVKTENIFAN